MYIPVILGTARVGRKSEKAANFVLSEVIRFGTKTNLIDVRDYLTGVTDNTLINTQSKKLSREITKADGIIIVSPEYNHGYPGELKIMLDMLYGEYHYKPVGICGVSIGKLGGARMVEQLRLVLIELHMIPIREAIYFGNISNLFDSNGLLTDPSYKQSMRTFLEELHWYTKILKTARVKKGKVNK